MEEQSEPVRVFIRIRPEFEDRVTDRATPGKGLNINSRGQPTIIPSSNNCCQVVDAQSLRVVAPDGVYGQRKAVSAVDDKVYTFDRVFPDTATQEEVYHSVAEHVRATVNGYNTTIFAYGTTGSGKSYTMTGDKTAPGIIPRAIGDLFMHIEKAANEGGSDMFFYVRLSYVELYNNNFRNLLETVQKDKLPHGRSGGGVNMSMNGFFTELDDGHEGPSFAHARNSNQFDMKLHPGLAHRNDKIEVRESQSAGVFLAGPNLRIPVTSATDAFTLIKLGNKYRAVGSTACNDVSSRSHAILTFHVESRTLSSPTSASAAANTSSLSSKAELRLGKIHLVDLAGSERLNLSGAEGDTRLETQNINLSLTALGDVLSALSKNAMALAQQQKQQQHGGGHGGTLRSPRADASFDGGLSGTLKGVPVQVPVPYRNSKLTHLLKDSLGGNSKTIMITTIRTTDEYFQQTNISLMYASRAKKVRNRSLVNRNVIGDTGIHTINSEIERLKKSLEDRTLEFDRLRMTQLQDAQENSSLKLRLQELKMANENEKALLEAQVSHVIHSQAGHIAAQKEKIATLQSALQEELTLSQNRIAEQEKEIKWLKKALDETSQAAQGPFDQMQRLQKMVEAWQTQAKTTHAELSVVLKQAEELKTLNSQLTSKLHEVEAARRQLQEEIAEHEQEALDIRAAATRVTRERDELSEQLESTARAYQEAKAALKDKAEALFDKEFVLKEHAKLISALEGELKLTKETAAAVQKDAQQVQAKMSSRIADLESDKSELTSRLNNAVSTLEKSTARVVEDANTKLQAKDGKIREADERVSALKTEVDHYRKLMEEYKRQLDVNEASNAQTVTELQASLKEERVANAQQAARILSLEGLADGFRDKILKLKTKDKETMDALRATVEKHEKELREKDRALHILGEQRDAERVSLMTEFERILEEKTLKHQTELAEAHAGATISAERMEAIEGAHRDELLRLRVEYEAKEQFFQHQLQETEGQVKTLIEHEIDSNIKRLESQHQAAIKKLKHDHEEELRAALQEAMAASSASAHKQHLHALEQRHAVYQAELDTMRTEFQQQLKAAQEDAKAQQDALKRTHEDQVAKLGKTHQQALDALESKIADQCERHYDQTLAVHDEKHRQDLAAAVEKERNRLTSHYEALVQNLRSETIALKEKHQQALKNIEFQRELHLQDAIEAERNKLLLQGRDQLEDQRSTLASEFAEQLKEQERRLTAKYTSQLEAQRREVQGEQEQALQQLATEQRRQIEALNAQKVEAEAHHVREMDLLMNSHKKALADARREAEVLMRVAAEEAERSLQAMQAQLAQQKVEHEERLREALGEQQRELIDRARSESLKLRTDLQEMEARHQAELNTALQAHVTEMAKQRKQLETAHNNLVESLQEELGAAKDRCSELLALAAAKEGQDAAALVEIKARADETTRRLLEERDKQHKIELDSAESQANIELGKLRAAMDKMRQRHETEVLQKEKDSSAEQGRAIAALKEKHRAEIAKLKTQHDQRIQATVQEIAGKGKVDHLRLLEERKEDEAKHQEAVAKMEAKVRELTQSLQKQRVEFEMEAVRLQEEMKAVEAQARAQREEDALRYSSLQAELENRFEGKHLLVLDTVREEGAAELARVKAEFQAQLQRKEAQLRQEVEQAREAAREETAQRDEEFDTLTAQLAEARRKHTAAATEVKALQQELAELRSQHEEVAVQANRLDVDAAEMQRRHVKEVQRLREERAEYERVSVEAEERLAKELQEVKLAARRQQSELQGAIMQKDFELQRLLSEAEQQHAAELQEHTARLKQAHQQQLEELRAQKDAEIAQLNEARAHIASLNAEVARVAEAMEVLRREHETHIEGLTEQANTEAKFLRDRITRLTQEAEDQAADTAQHMEQRCEALLEQLEEARQKAEQRHQEHLAELEQMQEQTQAAIHAERVQKANELDELRVALTTAHQREIRELRVKLEAGTVATNTVKDEMAARLNAALTEKEAQLRELQEQTRAQMAATLAQREQTLRAEFERERKRLCDSYEEEIESNAQSSKAELARRLEELQSAHAAEISVLQKRHAAALRDHATDSGTEVTTLRRELGEKEEEVRDVQRQLVKSETIREALKQDTENMRSERQQLREKVHVLELEIIEHGKAKFDARVSAEKDRLEQQYKTAFDDATHEVALKTAENKQLADRLAHGEMEIAAMRASMRTAQEERERLEESYKTALTEKEAAHLKELQAALDSQRAQMETEYLRLIQQQVDSLVSLIQNQSGSGAGNHSGSYDLQDRFLTLIKQLPDNWRSKNSGLSTDATTRSISPSSDKRSNSNINGNGAFSAPSASDLPRTPLHLLGQAARGGGGGNGHKEPTSGDGDQDLDNVRRSRFGGSRQSLPWSSPSLRSSPTDQLIAAILDGDVQGIRAVVRSKGEDLRSEFWRELTRSVFPLHRAVSGLHFHGSEKLLVATIETLAQLGADVNCCDHAGNSVLHKAIQVCTSKSAAAVVRTLLQRGANPGIKNKDGDTPLHSECKRVRSASVEVIEALVNAGCDPDCRNLNNSSVTPLSLVLLRGAASTATGVKLIGVGEEAGLGLGLSPPSNSRITADLDNVSIASNQAGGAQDPDRSRVAGRRVWIRAAEMLIKCGARWDVNWQTGKGCTQLHLLLSAFPPSRDDSATYRRLLKSALEAGLEVSAQEERGRTALFVLCEQMATVGSETCPDAPRLVHLLLVGPNGGHSASSARKVVNTADRTGRTVFDIVERADHSCLAVCRAVLRDAAQGVLHHDGSDYLNLNSAGQGGPSRRGIVSSNSAEWDADRPRASSSLIARVSQVSGGAASSGYSVRSEAETKRRTYTATATTAARTSSNYLTEEFQSDVPPIPLLRGSDGAQSQSQPPPQPHYGSSYYSPAVAARRPGGRPGYDEDS